MKNYGFILPEIKQEDFVFGDASIDAPVLQANGQWDAFLPKDEFQNINGFETFACGWYNTLNPIEILLRRKFGFDENYSDRWGAQKTGTKQRHGNDPHAVSEFIRKNGIVEEYEWPNAPAESFDDYYRDPPFPLDVSARTFSKHYEFFHDYVPNDPKSMTNALKYSPLGIAVYAWEQLPSSLYKAAPDATSQNHWVTCYGFEEGKFWKIFDSYDNSHKQLEWSHRPAIAKRYHIDLAPQAASFFQSLWKALLEALKNIQRIKESQQNDASDPPAPVVPSPTIPPTAPPPPRYDFSDYKTSRHSVRVICDEEGLSVYNKEVICACIEQESHFDNKQEGKNLNEDGSLSSTDWGLCQINDYWQIGPNKPFPNPQFVVDNPEKAVRFMVKMMKAGKLSLWSSYKYDHYLKYMP